jgi:hypothetical protein
MLERRAQGTGLIERLIAALRLDLRVYQEVSGDAAATGQAFRVVLLTGVLNGFSLIQRLGVAGVFAGVGAALIGWFLWAAVIFAVAAIFGHRRGARPLLRALGFANAPGMLLVLGVVPVIGAVIRLAVVAWLVAATERAVEAVFEVSRGRATLIAVAGFIAYLFLGMVSAYFAAS